MKIEHMLRPKDVPSIKTVFLVAVVGVLLVIYEIVRMAMTDFEQEGWWVVIGVTSYILIGIVIASLALKKCRRVAELNDDLTDNLNLVLRGVDSPNFQTFRSIVEMLHKVESPWYRLKTSPLSHKEIRDFLVLTYHGDKGGHHVSLNTSWFSEPTMSKVYERHGTKDIDTLRLAAYYLWVGEVATLLNWSGNYRFERALYADHVKARQLLHRKEFNYE